MRSIARRSSSLVSRLQESSTRTLAGRAPYICQSCTRQLRLPARSIFPRRGFATSAIRADDAIRSDVRRAESVVADKGPEIFDIVCVGGGPAGLSLCAALRSSPITSHLKIALVDASPLSKSLAWAPGPNEYSNRCSSLTPGSVQFLDDIGVWEHVEQSRVQPYEGMRVWDGVGGGSIWFQEEQGVAFMNENNNLVRALLRRLENLGGVDIVEGAKIEGIEYGSEHGKADLSGWPVVKLGNGREIAARLLVGADGANSPVRQWAGIESRGWEYGKVGVVATLELSASSPAGKTAFQRFLPNGPIAFLPLPGAKATLVWSTTPQHAAVLKALSEEDFTATVNAAFRLSVTDIDYMLTLPSGQLDEFTWRSSITSSASSNSPLPEMIEGIQANSRASFPLKMKHADSYTSERIALIGDAAHSIHPLAGQGLNMGQGDVEALIQCIARSVETGADLGVQLNLEPYGRERWGRNALLMGVCDGLERGFGIGSGPLVAVRSWGLDLVDRLEGGKKFVMGQASGKGSGLPDLSGLKFW